MVGVFECCLNSRCRHLSYDSIGPFLRERERESEILRAAIQVVSALVSVVTKYLFIQHLRGRVDGEGKENPCCSHRWHYVWAVWMCV